MPWLAGLIAGSMVTVAKALVTEEVVKRVFVDLGWHLAKKTTNDLDNKIVNTAAKALNYGYKPELEQ